MTAPDFGDSSVLLLDHQANVRQLIWSALKQIGFGHVRDCASLAELESRLAEEMPDLVIVDLDRQLTEVCARIVDMRHRLLGANPFVVIAATTWQPSESAVRRALDSGIDDLVAKPVSIRLVHDRIANLVTQRKEFVVTPEYFGPDRRKTMRARAPADEEIPTLAVPNSLRFKALGDRSALVSAATIEAALHDLDLQKLLRLCKRIDAVAQRCLARRAQGRPPSAMDREIDGMSRTALDARRIIARRELFAAAPLGESLSDTIQTLTRRPGTAARDFELLGLLCKALSAVVRGDGAALGVATGEIEAAHARAATTYRAAPRHAGVGSA